MVKRSEGEHEVSKFRDHLRLIRPNGLKLTGQDLGAGCWKR